MAPRGGELARRLAVAVLGIPVVIAALWAGGWWFGGLLALAATAASAELFGLVRARGAEPFAVTGMAASGAVVLISTANPTPLTAAAPILGVLVGLVLVTLSASVWLRWPAGEPQGSVSATLLGAVYVGCTLSCAIFLRSYTADLPAASAPPHSSWGGIGFVLLPLVSVWVGDSAAYFAGHAFGRRKLFPTASPGKTVEGGLAGLLGSALAGGIVAGLALRDLGPATVSPVAGAAIGALIGVAGPIGDVAESVLKREAGVKDSGKVLPGHGGVLDRLDSLLFAFPVTYAALVLFGIGR